MDNQDEQYEDLQNPPKRKRTRAASSTPEEELKKEMHRKCESVRNSTVEFERVETTWTNQSVLRPALRPH